LQSCAWRGRTGFADLHLEGSGEVADVIRENGADPHPARTALLAVVSPADREILLGVIAGRMRSRGRRSKARACFRRVRAEQPELLTALVEETCIQLRERLDRAAPRLAFRVAPIGNSGRATL
jgi:hypothetical protein